MRSGAERCFCSTTHTYIQPYPRPPPPHTHMQTNISDSRYCWLVRNAAFTSCAGEASLDAALASLLQTFRSPARAARAARAAREEREERAAREAEVAALRAHGAQLLSLQKSLFKDQQFASWQRASCAVEALRIACASALYASADAGGSHRKRWQALYDQANRLCNRLHETPDDAELLAIGPCEEQLPKRRDSEGTDDEEDEDEDEEPEEEHAEQRQQTAAQHGHLTQLLLDGLLRQALALYPQHEATMDVDTLERTFSHAETQLDQLSDIFSEVATSTSRACEAKSKERPWERVRLRKRSSLEVAEQAAQPALEQATKGLLKVQDSLERVGERLAKAKQEMQEAERQFGAARIQSERRALMLASVVQMQKQAKAGTHACSLLEEELSKQTQECNQMEDTMAEAKARCRELHHRLNELERRIMRRYCNDVSPEEVLALRRAVARQHAEIRELQLSQHRHRDGFRLRCSSGPVQTFESCEGFEEHVGSLWEELQAFREGLLHEHIRPKIVMLDEPEPEAAPDSQKARLRGLGQDMKALRERITDCAKQSSPSPAQGPHTYDSVALTRFLRATSAKCPASTVSVPCEANFSLPVLMDEASLAALHAAMLPTRRIGRR